MDGQAETQQGRVRPGKPRLGRAGQAKAGRGLGWLGPAREGWVRPGWAPARHGGAWRGSDMKAKSFSTCISAPRVQVHFQVRLGGAWSGLAGLARARRCKAAAGRCKALAGFGWAKARIAAAGHVVARLARARRATARRGWQMHGWAGPGPVR